VASASTYDPYFGQLDQIDQDAQKVGIKLGFMVTSPAPRWAEGTSGCNSGQINSAFTCRPSDADFKDFIKALGARYNGSVSGIPAVRWWSIWNEPNYIPNLSPQKSGSNLYEGATLYRGLLDAGYAGLAASGHTPSRDTILFGEVAPRGIVGTSFDAFGSKPVAFIAALYCESTTGKRFTGATASENGCGSNAAAFKKANPALFNASGFADHPYSQGAEPTTPTSDCHGTFCDSTAAKSDPLWTNLSQISNLENGLAKDLKTYGSTKKYSIWNTEYGYWTSPPGHNACHSASATECDLSQSKAAYYLNWSEYLSYKNSRIVSFDQYQLYDPSSGEWTDGLLTRAGAAKPAFDAYELPLFLPTTSVKKASNLTVWGGDRPAAYDAAHTKGLVPRVAIQFKAKSGGYKTLKTVKINLKNNGGYFTSAVKFNASGTVRLAYTVGGSTLYSRTQAITVG
jgi:hypothetical protein